MTPNEIINDLTQELDNLSEAYRFNRCRRAAIMQRQAALDEELTVLDEESERLRITQLETEHELNNQLFELGDKGC